MSLGGEFDELKAWLFQTAGESPRPSVDHWLLGRMSEDSPTESARLLWMLGGRLWREGTEVTPEPLARFMARVAELFSPTSVLDPVCGTGVLLHEVVVKTRPRTAHGVEIKSGSARLAERLLGDSARIYEGDVLDLTSQLEDTYDLIVADPPLGLRLVTPGTKKSEDFTDALIRWSVGRIPRGGGALFVIPPRLLWGPRSQSLQRAIQEAGCGIRALIYLPGGTLKTTASSNYLVVLDRAPRAEVFIGQLPTDDEGQQRLLANLRDHQSDRQLELGRLSELAEFKGFEALVARERVRRLVQGTQLTRIEGHRLFLAHQLTGIQGGDRLLAHGPSSCYLQVVGHPEAALGPEELESPATGQAKGALHLQLDLSLADPRYLVPWLNESAVGQATLASVIVRRGYPRVDVDSFLGATFHLPELAEQAEVVKGLTLLEEQKAEMYALRSRLWESGIPASEVVARIEERRVNRPDDDVLDWMDALPFPLASVLWRYHAGGEGEWRFRVLLHFLEATAAFLATIFLSAMKRSDELWEQLGPELRERIGKDTPPLAQASFGSWVQILEYLSARFGEALRKPEEADRIKAVLGTREPATLGMLTSKEVRKVLRDALSLRNRWQGHGGADNEQSAAEKEHELLPLVQTLQSAFRQIWMNYTLVRPGPGDFDGSLHHYQARSLMGARSDPFPVIDIATLEPLQSDHLYVVDAAGNTGLRLLDFIQVLPSAQRQAQTCYIYSRRVGGTGDPFVFVSYHFAPESERRAADPEVEAALDWLHSFD